MRTLVHFDNSSLPTFIDHMTQADEGELVMPVSKRNLLHMLGFGTLAASAMDGDSLRGFLIKH